MLHVARYVTIAFSIIAQACLGALGTGNLLDHLNPGVFLSVNACLAISGVLSTLFLSIVVLTELAQKEATTTTSLVEVIWSSVLWGITTVEASYLSSTRLTHCGQSGSWDLCMAHTIAVPLCWAAAGLSTIHLAILIYVIDWHRTKSAAAVRQEWRGRIRAKPSNPLESLQQSLAILQPIMLQSVFMLLKTKTHMSDTSPSSPLDFHDKRKTIVDRMSRVFRPGRFNGDDKDERTGLRFDIEQPRPSGEGWAVASYYQEEDAQDPFATMLVASPSVVSFSPQPRARMVDLPRLQLRDEPITEVTIAPRVRQSKSSSRHGRTDSRKERLLSIESCAQSPQSMNSAGSRSPRPQRSLTLPSVSAPQPARLVGVTPLGRSLTVGARRPVVPTRYGSMDLTVPDFGAHAGLPETIKAPPRPPPGSLPRPTRRYQ